MPVFTSPNFAPIARVGVDVEINWDLVRPPTAAPQRVVAIGKATVGAFRLFPGIHADYIANLLLPPVQGVVLECFGSGNAPSDNRPLMNALRTACDRGVVVVAVTQTLRGSADLTHYATGRALLDAGVTCGYDMTPEAALAKLYYLFESGHDPAEVRRLAQQDLRGEVSAPAQEVPQSPSLRARGTQRYRGL